MPQGSAEGTNDFRRLGYGGPCPPPGKPHHYLFRLYALDIRLDSPPGATRKELDAAIENGISLPRVKSSESTGAQATRG